MKSIPAVKIKRTVPELAQMLPVFGTEAFLAAKSPEYGWFVSDDGALPFVIDRRLCFSRLIFTTETVHLHSNITCEEERQFLDQVMSLCCQGAPGSIDFVATAQANAVFQVVPSNSESLEWGSYVVDLTEPESAIFDKFHSKHRNVIRKAMASDVTVASTSDTQLIYNSLKETMTRQGLLFYPSQSYLDRLKYRLGDNVIFYIAKHKDAVQGTAVVVHNHLAGFYYYGGSIATPFTGSLNLMQYEIMRDLKRRGTPLYDLMGARINTDGDSKIEGIQRFKSRFASGMRRGYCFRRIVRPAKHRTFSALTRGYFALKGSRYAGDVIDQAANRQLGAGEPPLQRAPF